jgi:hypothetical protein
MKKIFLITLSLILLSLSALAQKENNKTDSTGLNFSGSWILDEKKSFFSSERRERYEDYVLEITQKESEIKIDTSFIYRGKEFKYALVLFFDKRGEENVQAFEQMNYSGMSRSSMEDFDFWLEDVKIKTTTFLNKDKLVRRGVFTISGVNQILNEEYKLSKDGKTLSINSHIRIQVSPLSGNKIENSGFKLIFQKKES